MVTVAAKKEPDYQQIGACDHSIFEAEFREKFSKNSRFSEVAIPQMLTLLDLIERDTNITDLRWTAYMLATVMWETTSPTTRERPAHNKKGKTLLDKQGQPIMVKSRAWLMTMAPVDEIGHGKGRKYHEPVKAAKLADGSVRITEQDGDQFKVGTNGIVTNLTKKAVMGTVDGGLAVKAYDDDTGDELAYFGRGYVQLTWWSNYSKSSVAIGLGLELLLDPERVKEPEVAYALMSHGMRTGQGFANGHRLGKYFSGKLRNYVGARHMVNGHDHASDIANIAEKFEAILLKSKLTAQPTNRLP